MFTRYLENLLDRVPVGILICGVDGGVLHANAEAAKILRTSVEAMVGSSLAVWLPLLDLAQPYDGSSGIPEMQSSQGRAADGSAVALSHTVAAMAGPRTDLLVVSLLASSQAPPPPHKDFPGPAD